MGKYMFGNYYWVTYEGHRFIATAIETDIETGAQIFQEVSTGVTVLETYCSDIVEIID